MRNITHNTVVPKTTYTIRCGRTAVGVYFSRQSLNRALSRFAKGVGVRVEVEGSATSVSSDAEVTADQPKQLPAPIPAYELAA